jgi:hypothetical protein
MDTLMQDQPDLRARLETALAEGQRLREEVRHIGERCLPAPSDIAQLGTLSDNPAKIALFRSLFRGREDVYAE